MIGIHYPGWSQRYFVRNYNEADGVSSNMVYDVAQDTSGLLWFATRSGVCSYDGKNWMIYAVDPSLKQFSFLVIVSDERGTLWTIPHQGEPMVFRFSGTHWYRYAWDTVHHIKCRFSAFTVAYEDHQPLLALGTDQEGVFIFQRQQWHHFTTGNGLLSDQINGLVWVNGQLVVATDKGISVIRDGMVSNQWNQRLPADSRNIFALSPIMPPQDTGTSGNLWLLGEGWLGMLSPNSFSKVLSGFPISVKNVSVKSFIHPNPSGSLFFGNPFYLYYWLPSKKGKPEKLTSDNGLIGDGATAVCLDREHNTWITGYRGISKVPSRRFTNYTTLEGLADNEVASAVVIRPGSYVFGHHGALTFYRNGEFEKFSFLADPSRGLPELRVQDLAVDRNGNVWAAVSALGIARINSMKQITWYQPAPNVIYSSIIVLPDGSIFASADKALFQYMKTSDRFVEVPLSKTIKDLGIRKLFSGNESTLILGTYSSGILEMKGKSERVIKSPSDELANSVYSYFKDSQGNRWVGTVIGLYIIENDELKRVDHDGLRIDRPVYLILEDKDGNLWFGTDNGIYRWNGNILDHFTSADGISGQEINRDAGIVDEQGTIWFGTNFGITCFHPEYGYQHDTIPSPIVKLKWFEVNGDTFSCQQPVSLSYSANNLSFSFHALSFINEDNILYSFKLEGFDDEWSAPARLNEGEYRYNNLLPGKYTFCLKARNAIGIWSDPVCSANIRIKQPFWFQWWFLLILVAFFVSLSYILIRLFVTRRYNLRLAKMVAIRTRELRRSEKELKESNEAKDNFFSIIAHDLKSPFNAILGMLELLTTEYSEFSDQEKQKILMSLRMASTRTIDLLENLLTWARSQKGLLPFTPEKFDLMELIRENVFLFEPNAKTKRIALNLPVWENVIVYGDRNMINTVIRNLVSNAIKFTYPDGDVTIRIDRDSQQKVTVSIEDNGCGLTENAIKDLFILDRRTTSRGTANETGTGLGLILSHEFIRKNGGQMWVESKPEEGTTFYFSLPVNPPGK